MGKQGFELRLRKDSAQASPPRYGSYSSSRGSAAGKKPATSLSQRLSNSTIVCVCILIAVTVLKMLDWSSGKTALETFSQIVNTQTDFEETADNLVNFFGEKISQLTGKEISVVSPPGATLTPPLAQGTIVKEFVGEEHPVFNTLVAPRGVKIASEPSAYVYSTCAGEVSALITNEDGTRRLVVAYSRTMSVAYDNLAICYASQGSKVKGGEILGILSEENPVLAFEVWVNNEAKDPVEFIGPVYQ